MARPKRAAPLRTKTTNSAPTIAPDSAAGTPRTRPVRHTRTSKKAPLTTSQPHQLATSTPAELPTTSQPHQLATSTPAELPTTSQPPHQPLTTSTPTELPLPLQRPTPTPSDVDVDRLIGGEEYEVANTRHLLRPVQPDDWNTTPSLCPAPHPPHPITQYSPEPSASEDHGSGYGGTGSLPGAKLKGTEAGNMDHLPTNDGVVITDLDKDPSASSAQPVPTESELTKSSTLTPSMEAEVEEWLKTIGGAWVHGQEEKHGVPTDVWLAKIHHLTRQYSKSSGGLNSWNVYQKWWRHHHPEDRPLGSDVGARRKNTERIISAYHKKMEELGTRQERDNWCKQVEEQLGCSAEIREDGVPPGLLRLRKLENDVLNIIVPAVLSKIYIFVGIIPANPLDPIARAASGIIVNDPLVSGVLHEEGTDVRVLFNNLELGVRNHIRKQEGMAPLLKGAKVDFNTASPSKKKATASEIDGFDISNKPSAWCDMELEASQAMVALLEQAPVLSAGWNRTTNRLPEPWWQFAHLLLHRDPSLDELPAERDEIIQTFRKHVQLMTHDPVRKNGGRALALIDSAIQGLESTLSRHVRTEYRTWGRRLVKNDRVIGNWPGKAATGTIPIRSKKIGDSRADDYRAILLAILEVNEERRLYVGKRPEGADWLVKRVDGECVLRSEYQSECNTLPHSAAPPRSPSVPITLSPAPSTKPTKPVHRKRKGLSTTIAVTPHPNALVVHTPLDLQPIKELFNPYAADDTASTSANGHQPTASEDLDYQLDAILQPTTSALMVTQKRSVRVPGKRGGALLESSPTKRFRGGAGLLHSDTDIVSSGPSPRLAPSTLLGSLPPASRSMDTNTITSDLGGQDAALGHSAPPGTALGHLPYPQFPPYGYGMAYPPVPPGMPGMPGMSQGFPTNHTQMQPPLYHPMMNYYFPPGYGQQPPPPPMQ